MGLAHSSQLFLMRHCLLPATIDLLCSNITSIVLWTFINQLLRDLDPFCTTELNQFNVFLLQLINIISTLFKIFDSDRFSCSVKLGVSDTSLSNSARIFSLR